MANAKAATLVDRFQGGSLDPAKWITQGEPEVLQNELKIKNSTTKQGVKSVNVYDLTGSYFQVHLRTVDQAQFQVRIDFPDGNYVQMSLVRGNITGTAKQGGITSSKKVLFDPTGMTWWRIKEDTGTLSFDVSYNGTTWASIHSVQRTVPVDDASVQMISYSGGFGFGPWGIGPLGGTASSGLKAKVVGGYFAKYKSTDDLGVTRDMTFQQIDPRYDVVYLFQAGPIEADGATYPQGTGAVDLIHEGGGAYFSPAEWKIGVQYLRNRGTTVILTVGGGGAYIDMSTRAKTMTLIQSVKDIYKQVGGFDGIDFNLETSFAYVRGGTGVPSTGAPAISMSSDQKTITDPGLLNRVTYNGAPNLLKTNELVTASYPYQLHITTGTGAGQYRNITANTQNTITVDTAFSPALDATSLYEVGLPLFVPEIIYAAQQFRKLYGSDFSISVPSAGTFYGPFIQHDIDLVQGLYTNVDATGKKLLDFLAPQIYDLWYDAPDTTMSARASYCISVIANWASRVGNDWSRVGIGFLTNGPLGSKMTTSAAQLAYLLTQVAHPTVRGAFHFDIQGDRRQGYDWIEKLAPLITATEVGGVPQSPLPGTGTDFSTSTGWGLSGGATISGGNLNLPFGNYGDIRLATYSGGAKSLLDGYIQIELTTSIANANTNPEAWLDFGWTGATDAEFTFFRFYKSPTSGNQGYELHRQGTITGGVEKINYYPYPTATGPVFLRFRKLFDYMFMSASSSGSDSLHTIAFEELVNLPGYTNMHIFIRSNGQATSGQWTISSFNQGGPSAGAPVS